MGNYSFAKKITKELNVIEFHLPYLVLKVTTKTVVSGWA